MVTDASAYDTEEVSGNTTPLRARGGLMQHQQIAKPALGNPRAITRGRVARGIMLGLLVKDAAPMHDVMMALGVGRTAVLWHLARLRDAARIRAFTTSGGVVRVWR